MTVLVITPPDALVDLATAKAHLRIDGEDQDTLITAYVAAASAHIDGPGGWLNRAIGAQTLELVLSGSAWLGWGYGCALPLSCPPVATITSVKYLDVDGVQQTLSAGVYALRADGSLALGFEQEWPSPRDTGDAIRIRYTAGSTTIPAAITAAVLLMAGDLYANRETVVIGDVAARIPMSTAVENLLAPYRNWRL